jgi:hypothetical protein
MKTLLLSLALLPLLAVPATAAPAAPSSTATATVEITTTPVRGVATTARIDAALTLDRGTTQVRSSTGPATYQVKMAWRSDDKGLAPLFELDVEEHRDKQIPTRIEVRSRLELGKRVSLGRITRQDGSRFEVFVTLR